MGLTYAAPAEKRRVFGAMFSRIMERVPPLWAMFSFGMGWGF